MADKLEWMNKHFVAVRYTGVSDMVTKENYKIRPDLEACFAGVESAETMAFKLAEDGKWKDACELMTYFAHRRAAVWWLYRCVISLMEERILNPAGERDIAEIGINMEPEVPEFAKIELPKPDPEALAQVDAMLADAREKVKQTNALLDQDMLRYVEEGVEIAFQEFKRVHGIHPMDLLKQIGAQLTQPRVQIDPASPIILETAKLKAQLVGIQKDTVETIKSVLPPKMPAHQKKLSDNALAAVYRWVAAPGPENAQRCLDVGNECPDQPGGLLSLSAFWSFGNLMPAGDQVIPTPPGLASNGLTQTLLLCALSPGGVRKVKERYAEYFRLGVEVLTGADNWEASLAEGKMPHEQLPEPDWSKASDKSASDWQAEMGIAELKTEEKEKAIKGMIAEAKGEDLAAGVSPLKRNGAPNGTAPAYKRWKP
jgi:mono/diheme cytochrome c family protein